MRIKRLFANYLMAIQNVNRVLYLENQIPILKQVRFSRNDQCHYLKGENPIKDDSLYDDRLTVLLFKLNNVLPEIKIMFDMQYPSLLSDLLNTQSVIIKNPTTPSKIVMAQLEYWWNF